MKKSTFIKIAMSGILLILILASSASLFAETAPILVKQIDISAGGPGCRMRIGDLNGDGRLDLLMVQPNSGINDATEPHDCNMLTAYDGYTGAKLWQVGGPSNGITSSGSDEPCEIYDIDNDGYNEVVCVMHPDKFEILNGATGAIKKQYTLPSANAHDCILFAHFTQSDPKPMDIVLKDRYNNIWAYNKSFTKLWSVAMAVGHYPWPYDFNGDGKDEIMVSYTLLSSTGAKMFTCANAVDHADCIQVGNVDGASSNGMEIALGTQGTYTTMVYNWKGTQLWSNSTMIESQQLVAADFRTDKSGLELFGLDRVSRDSTPEDALFLFAANGSVIWKENPTNKNGYGTAIHRVRNWNGSNTPMVVAHKRGGSIMPKLYDGNMTVISTFPVEGNTMVADMGGDSKQEIIMYTTSTAYIYANSSFSYSTPAPSPGHPRAQIKELYNFSRYGSGEN